LKTVGDYDKIAAGQRHGFTFYKARGLSVSQNFEVEDNKLQVAKSLETKAKERGVTFLLFTY
jgi:phosphoglycerate kinase